MGRKVRVAGSPGRDDTHDNNSRLVVTSSGHKNTRHLQGRGKESRGAVRNSSVLTHVFVAARDRDVSIVALSHDYRLNRICNQVARRKRVAHSGIALGHAVCEASELSPFPAGSKELTRHADRAVLKSNQSFQLATLFDLFRQIKKLQMHECQSELRFLRVN
jgi:hypothetical protein